MLASLPERLKGETSSDGPSRSRGYNGKPRDLIGWINYDDALNSQNFNYSGLFSESEVNIDSNYHEYVPSNNGEFWFKLIYVYNFKKILQIHNTRSQSKTVDN